MTIIKLKTRSRKKLKAVEMFFDALKLSYSIDDKKDTYSKKFIDKVEQAHKEFLNGETIDVDAENVWQNIK